MRKGAFHSFNPFPFHGLVYMFTKGHFRFSEVIVENFDFVHMLLFLQEFAYCFFYQVPSGKALNSPGKRKNLHFLVGIPLFWLARQIKGKEFLFADPFDLLSVHRILPHAFIPLRFACFSRPVCRKVLSLLRAPSQTTMSVHYAGTASQSGSPLCSCRKLVFPDIPGKNR